MDDLRLTVSGMACESCARRVEEALESVDGVWKVTATPSPSTGRSEVRVRCMTDVAVEPLATAVEDAGYQVVASSSASS